MSRACRVLKRTFHPKVWPVTAYHDEKLPHLNREASPGRESYVEMTIEHENAVWHWWGNDYEQGEGSHGNFTVGIVELPDGTIITPAPTLVQFKEPIHANA